MSMVRGISIVTGEEEYIQIPGLGRILCVVVVAVEALTKERSSSGWTALKASLWTITCVHHRVQCFDDDQV